jgi:hypothetical protein
MDQMSHQQCPTTGNTKSSVRVRLELDGEFPKCAGPERCGGWSEPEADHSNTAGHPGALLQHVYLQAAFIRLGHSEDHPRASSVNH